MDRLAEIAAGSDQAPQWPRVAYASLLQSERVVLVAEDAGSGAVAGFVVARLILPEAELESIAVAGEFQRRGVARELFSALSGMLGRSGGAEIMLEVRAGNGAALGFYRSLGFVEEGRRRGYYADPVEDAVLMRLRLRIGGSGGRVVIPITRPEAWLRIPQPSSFSCVFPLADCGRGGLYKIGLRTQGGALMDEINDSTLSEEIVVSTPNIVATLSGWKIASKALSLTDEQLEEVRLKKLKLHAKDLIYALEHRAPVIA